MIRRALGPLAAAGALATSFGLGFAFGRGETEESGRASARGSTLAAATAKEKGAREQRARSIDPNLVARDAAPHAHDHAAAEMAAESAGEAGPIELDLDGKLALARALAANPTDEHVQDAALAAAGELEQAVKVDPAALKQVLARFEGARDPAELEMLASVLGRVKDLEVEEAALAMARSGSPEVQAAAFDVLDGLDLPSARAASLEGLERSRDTTVRRAALRALPVPAGASFEEAGAVVSTLAAVVGRDQDPELRRRAAVELGRWHREPADLGAVLTALARDPDPNVRAGAAFGLELSGRRDPQVVQALVGAVRREDEDTLVRENAWKALSALGPLPAEIAAEWKRFEDELGARDEQ